VTNIPIGTTHGRCSGSWRREGIHVILGGTLVRLCLQIEIGLEVGKNDKIQEFTYQWCLTSTSRDSTREFIIKQYTQGPELLFPQSLYICLPICN